MALNFLRRAGHTLVAVLAALACTGCCIPAVGTAAIQIVALGSSAWCNRPVAPVTQSRGRGGFP